MNEVKKQIIKQDQYNHNKERRNYKRRNVEIWGRNKQEEGYKWDTEERNWYNKYCRGF